jgi:putative transposase
MKPGVFTQMYIQLIIAVKNRDTVLNNKIKNRVFEYISGILKEMGHRPFIVNGIYDHAHIFFGLNPNRSISETVHDIKRGSSVFINEKKLCSCKFMWQEGYGSFSYSRSQVNNVYQYIKNQEEHHRKHSFKEEYIQFLEKFEIEFDHRFLFDFHS